MGAQADVSKTWMEAPYTSCFASVMCGLWFCLDEERVKDLAVYQCIHVYVARRDQLHILGSVVSGCPARTGVRYQPM